MVTITKYANTISQTSGKPYSSFQNLNNLKNANNTYAKTALIEDKYNTYKRPSTLTLTNFGFNIPTGARINSIKVEYAQQKLAKISGKEIKIAAPSVTLVGSGMNSMYAEVLGTKPTATMTKRTSTWNGTLKTTTNIYSGNSIGGTVTYPLPTVQKINSSGFGVKINYDANTSANEGYMQLQYVRIIVDYTPVSYALNVSDVYNQDHIVDEEVTLNLTLNNVITSKYNPTVRIDLPENCVFDTAWGTGSVTQSDERTLLWNTDGNFLSTDVRIRLKFLVEGDTSVTFTETLTGVTKTFNLHIFPTPTSVEVYEVENVQSIYARADEEFIIPIEISTQILETITSVIVSSDNNMSFDETSPSKRITIPASSFVDGVYNLKVETSVTGVSFLFISTTGVENTTDPSYIVKVIPSDFMYPGCIRLSLTEEELNRLGDGYTYTVESYLKVICNLSDTSLFQDYYKNFRIGVFNEAIEENIVVTNEYLIDNCNKWSEAMSVLNSWEEKTVDFVYNEENPLYLLITSEYNNAHPNEFELQCTDIAIIENYTQHQPNGNFPIPIKEVITTDGDSVIDVALFEKSNPFTVYSFPVGDNFGTNDEYAVRGVELRVNAEVDNNCVLQATLKNGHGNIGSRSVVLNPSNQINVSMGGEYDLWGFKISEMTNLEQWEIELELNNIFQNDTGVTTISIDSIEIVFYFNKIEEYYVQAYVNGENLAWYTMFLLEAPVPVGVNTNTKYITVEGTDTNDAYLMTLDAKEITLKFGVYGCNIYETTKNLQEIGKLLVNERDELNKPIPNILELSNYPDEQFEFILEKAFEPDVDAADYESEVKLIIPAGTSYSKDEITSGATGIVDGIAKINPVITIIPTGENVEIVEELSEQKFNFGYTDYSNKIIEIDCINRRLLLKSDENDDDPTDISQYVDFNSDWFILHGPFSFVGTNAIIQTVTRTERM